MENLVVATQKKITMDEFISQIKVVANSSVKKILSVSAKTYVSSVECANNVASASGKIRVNLIYLNDENVIESSENYYDFAEKQRINFSLTDVSAKDVVELNVTGLYTSEVVCNVVHHMEIVGVYKYEMPIISNEDDSLVLSKKSFESLKFVTSSDDDFVVAEETEIAEKNIIVLSSNATAILTDISCTVDKVILEGKVITETICKEEEQIGQIVKEFDFKQEVSADGTLPNMIVDAYALVKNITVTAETSEEKTTLIYAIDMQCKCYVFEENTYEVVSDMFSLKTELQTTYDYYEAKNYAELKHGEENFSCQKDVSEVAGLDDVLNVSDASVKVLGFKDVGEKVLVNIFAEASAFCRTGDGYESVKVSKETEIELDKGQSQSIKNIDMSVSVVSFKVKAGKDLDVNFKLEYNAKFETEVSSKYVKAFEEKGEKEQNSFGIKVYISKEGQTVFDVAKVLNVKPETITSQNQVDDVFEQGQKIYVYSPVNLA